MYTENRHTPLATCFFLSTGWGHHSRFSLEQYWFVAEMGCSSLSYRLHFCTTILGPDLLLRVALVHEIGVQKSNRVGSTQRTGGGNRNNLEKINSTKAQIGPEHARCDDSNLDHESHTYGYPRQRTISPNTGHDQAGWRVLFSHRSARNV